MDFGRNPLLFLINLRAKTTKVKRGIFNILATHMAYIQSLHK